MGANDGVESDGRRLRRERGRETVIDALYDLLAEGIAPTTEALVERSGVSLSSIFRYFASIDDLQRQAIERHFARSAELFEVPRIGEGERDDRIRRWVDARLALHEAVAPVARLARSRAHDHPLLAETLDGARVRMAVQAEVHFAPELAEHPPTRAADLAVLVATLTGFESWEQLTTTHGRTRTQLRRAWIAGLDALLG